MAPVHLVCKKHRQTSKVTSCWQAAVGWNRKQEVTQLQGAATGGVLAERTTHQVSLYASKSPQWCSSEDNANNVLLHHLSQSGEDKCSNIAKQTLPSD